MGLKRKRRKALRAIFKQLRKRFPLKKGEEAHLSIFRFEKRANCYGITRWYPKRKLFLIDLDSRLLIDDFGRAVEVLLHEYAHARAWTTRDHGKRWSLAFGRLYRWYFD